MKRRDTIIAGVALTLVLGPALITMALYYITKNPDFRPLSLTKESLTEYRGETGGPGLTVEVVLPIGATLRMPREEFEQMLRNSFSMYGTGARFVYSEEYGLKAPQVTYVAGASRIGPYSPNNLASGIKAAAAAFQIEADRDLRQRIAAFD
ncbi:hypothetical protein [Candidatus Halocynthiibacter alkanivorans]|jgi:hypothetical protein|uniref:hypothetical protein n=1 Tax=Candidatus Halocynthiibacter alkanivorans TaxID=2267619 RepID=UPI000DF11924|nr:hypothetical protein [Candidatus Halocynthiibacter alkanivorans]